MAAEDMRFQGVVRLTRIGSAYLAFTLIIGFAALNTGNNSLYITLSFMLGTLIFSGVASRGGLSALEVEISDLEDVWAGSPADGNLRLHNGSRIWNVRDVVILSPDLETPVLAPQVRRRSTVEVPAAFQFQRRGRAQVRRLEMYTRYPFGFFLKRRVSRPQTEIIVFPRLLTRESRRRDVPSAGDDLSRSRPGDGQEIHALRDYVTGDSVRQIHWKKSAALGRWIFKQHASDTAGAIHLVVDPHLPRGVSSDAFEELVSEAATAARDAYESGSEVILHLPGGAVTQGIGGSVRPLFEALALLDPTTDPSATPDYVAGGIVFSLRNEAAA
jgi:uncharacterized protein (DUF58 family)